MTPALVLAAAAPKAFAQSDYSDKDFSVRAAPAFLRFTEVSAMGGETVANRFSSASNPAAVGWFSLPGKIGVVASPYYSGVRFGNGTWLHLVGESLTWDTREWGAFQPTLSQTRGNNRLGRDGLSFKHEVDSFQLQWGKKFGNFGLGAAFNFADAHTGRDGSFTTLMGEFPVPIRVDSKGSAESYRWRLGGLYQPAEKWLLGLIFEYGFQHYRSATARTIMLPPQMGGGTTMLRDDGFQHQFILRPGVSYEYAKLSSVYCDYQLGFFFNKHDQLDSHRFSAGIEHRLLEWLLVRAGPSMDVRGNLGLSCGASVFLSEWASVELGYQHNMLPELRQEFGTANTIQATLAIRF